MATKAITRVTCRWDDQAGVEPGWYCESWSDDDVVDDSQKVWFPVEVVYFDRSQTDELRESLVKAFPFADIVVED